MQAVINDEKDFRKKLRKKGLLPSRKARRVPYIERLKSSPTLYLPDSLISPLS